MCAVSFIGDHYTQKWQQYPWYDHGYTTIATNLSAVSRTEFDVLKKEVEEMRQLLLRAKEYDERTGQPDCEMEDKVKLLRIVAKAVGVDIDSVFKPPV